MRDDMGRTMCRALALALGLTLSAAVGPARADHDAELADLQMVLDAVDHASPDVRLTLLAAGFEELDRSHGWDGSCEDAFGAYAKASLDLRSHQITAAFPGCPALCPSGPQRGEILLRLGMAPPLRRTEMLAAACDASGATPIFDEFLLPVRAQMPADGYWVFRAGFDLVRQRLDAIGGERASELRDAYDALVTTVAADLARHLPPSEMVDRLPATTSLRLPSGGPALVVREDVLIFGRTRVVETNWGEVPGDQLEGQRILPLYDSLEEAAGEGEPGALLVQMDGDLPVAVLDRVLYTAAKAGFRNFELAGIHAGEARQAVTRTWVPDLARYLGTGGSLDERPPLLLTVRLTEKAIEVAGSAWALNEGDGPGVTIGWDHPDPTAELHDLLLRVKDEYPDEEEVIVVPEGELPYHRLMGVLDACRDRWPEGAWRPEDLFPDIILASTAPIGFSGGPEASGSGLGSVGGLIGAEGLGGLGTRGRVPDGEGYGVGGGNFGRKGVAGSGVGTADPIVLGALAKEEIQEVIRRNLAQIRYCYQRELAKNPELEGKVVVKFVIAKDGTVQSASTRSSTLGNAVVETCVNNRFLRMQFPEPAGGGIVIVSYPFLFTSAAADGE